MRLSTKLRMTPVAATLMLLAGGRGPAAASEKIGERKTALEKLEEGDAIRNRLLLHGGRFEAAPALGFTINDAFQQNLLFGGHLTYHISEAFALGLTVFGGAGLDTGLAKEVEDQRPSKVDNKSFSNVGLVGTLDFYYTPLLGKFALFGRSVFAYDLHTLIGVGGTKVAGNTKFDDFSVAPVVGVGFRTFINDWMALNVEVRDYIFSSALNAVPKRDSTGKEKVEADASISNNFAIIFSLGFYLPTEPELDT